MLMVEAEKKEKLEICKCFSKTHLTFATNSLGKKVTWLILEGTTNGREHNMTG